VSDEQELAEQFSAARPRLIRIAYAILGSYSEAEDVVAETWLRLAQAHRQAPVRDVDGWTTVAVGRAALDAYRSARRRREVYVGPWLPEPLVGELPDADPADRVTLDDSVSFALLVVLEALSPAERTAWVLHDLFGLPFTEVADVVGRKPDAVRQLAARARAHLRDRAPRFPVDADQHRQAVNRFLAASTGGQLADLVAVLDPEVTLTSDGGGQVTAARRPVHGADRVARFLVGLATKQGGYDEIRVVDVNGYTGIAAYQGNRLVGVASLTVDGGRITRIDIVRAPGKLLAHRADAGS
jgi:RNA polymerase sigma-70 factor (ECF subfamily)